MLIGFFCSVLGLALGFYGSEKIFSEETLPVPAGASERLQQVIGQAGLPSVATRKLLVPRSEDQWRTAARLHADNQPESIAQLSARLAVDHQPDVKDGVAVHWLQPGLCRPSPDPSCYLLHTESGYRPGTGVSTPINATQALGVGDWWRSRRYESGCHCRRPRTRSRPL